MFTPFRLQASTQALKDSVVILLAQRALSQCEVTLAICAEDIVHRLSGIMPGFHDGAVFRLVIQIADGFQYIGHSTLKRGRRLHPGRPLAINHVGYHKGMVCRKGTPGFCHECRARQIILFANVRDTIHNGFSILVECVVHGTETARSRAFVIHAKATAHVQGIHRGAKIAQVGIHTRGFRHAGADVGEVRQLGTEVEMHHV